MIAVSAPLRAAQPSVRVAGEARSVIVVAEAGEREKSVVCADDGTGGDKAPGDGVWTCGDLPMDPGFRVAVVVDGARLLGPWDAPGDLGAHPTIDPKAASPLSAGAPRPGAASAPRPARRALVVEVDRGHTKQAFMLGITGSQGSLELPCQDNGEFPDREMNDDVAVCATVSPGDDLTFQLRTSAESLDATLTWLADGSGLQVARWTSTGLLRVERRGLLPPRADTTASNAIPAGTGTGGPSPQAVLPVGRPPEGGRPPEERVGHATTFGLTGWLALLTTFLAGALAVRLWRGPGRRGVPDGLLAVAPVQRFVRHPVPDPSTEAIAMAIAQVAVESAREGPVVLVLPAGYTAPWAAPGPVLLARSNDVLDVIEALVQMREGGPLPGPTVVTVAGTLTHAHGLGVDPVEQLLRDTPPNVRLVVIEPAGAHS